MEPIRIDVRFESREHGDIVLWSGIAQLVEPGRRPFEVIDSASYRDAANQQECTRLVILALQRRIERVFGVGNRYDDLFKTKLREMENQARRK